MTGIVKSHPFTYKILMKKFNFTPLMDLKILGFRGDINTTTSLPLYCDTLRDLTLFVQFKKRKKLPWWSVTFLKLCKWYQVAQRISYGKS